MQRVCRKPGPHTCNGFTLLEVMMAMAIFIIGFTAVMTLFPAALLLQKRTIDDVQSQNVARNAEAIIAGRTISLADLPGEMDLVYPDVLPGPPNGIFDWREDEQVYPLPPSMLPNVGGGAVQEWTLADRSYPVNIPTVEARRFFWVPMVQDADSGAGFAWRVYVFVLRRGEGLQYSKPGAQADWGNQTDPTAIPGVQRIPLVAPFYQPTRFYFDNDDGSGRPLVRVGNWVLDSNGGIFQVSESNALRITVNGLVIPDPGPPTHIWIGRPSDSGGPSPAQRIVLLTGVVK